jgi:hypothetical protein
VDTTGDRARLPEAHELATPVRENWIVQTESLHDGRGRVYLELADGTPAEAERGMAILKKLVG